eukprot:TRINITY_DN60517_c0_g1_i1.p1 TRINITY_DN60517_c0_g1~~TRINITY_DN60517_c0_g1_i1.p1  ORF type:complete len:2287 (+),score=694.22 TRINITY_DN60517_c0_g1_i1:128-6988(+)
MSEMTSRGAKSVISSVKSIVGENSGMRVEGINASLFPLILLLESTWPDKVTVAASIIDYLQPLGFVINPHFGWGQLVGSLRDVVFWSHIPLFDNTYNGGMSYMEYAAFFWLIVLFGLGMAGVLVALSGQRSDKKYTQVINAIRAMAASVCSWLFIPILHCLAALMVCDGDGRVWMFGEDCWTPSHALHFTVGCIILLAILPVVYLYRCSVFEMIPNTSYLYSKAHTHIDSCDVWYKVVLVFLYHTFVGRGEEVAFACVIAALSLGMALLHGFLMPHYSKVANSLKVSQMITVVTAAVIYICTDLTGVAEESGARGVLLLGLLPIGALAGYLMGTARISAACMSQVHGLEEGHGAPSQDPFVFPAGLPSASSYFTATIFVFGNPDGLFAPERIHTAASESVTWVDAQEMASSIVSLPYITHVRCATDVELATRSLLEFFQVAGRDPPQVMLNFASHVYAKGLLRFIDSAVVKLHYAWFLFIIAARPQVAHNFLERNESVVNCLETQASVNSQYNAYKLTDRLRRKLNIRERHHEEYGRNAQKMHETVLRQMHQFWLRLMELSVDMMQIGFLATSISENREKGMLQFQRALSDDLQMLAMFADFLEQVMLDKDSAQQCREEIREMEQEKKTRQMGGSAKRVATSDSGKFVQKLLEGISTRKDTFGSAANSTIRKLSLNMNLVFLLLVLIVVGNVVFELEHTRGQILIVDKMDSAGQTRMLAQKAAYETYDLFSVLDEGQRNQSSGQLFRGEVVEDQRTVLKETGTRFSNSHNELTHGGRGTSFEPHVVHFKQPLTEVNLYPYGLPSRQGKIVSLWSLGNMVTNALHMIDVNLTLNKLRAAVDASQASNAEGDVTTGAATTLTGLREDPSVLFITENTPGRIAVAFNRSMEFYKDEDDHRLLQAVYALIGLFVSSVLVVVLVYLLFLWYFKKITVSKMITLQLFTLIPYETLERLSTEAKERLEVVRRSLRRGPQTGRLPDIGDGAEDGADVQIPPTFLEELRHYKPGDPEVRELTVDALPLLEGLLTQRIQRGLLGEDTDALQLWVSHLRGHDIGGHGGGDGALNPFEFVRRNIIHAPVPAGILRKPPTGKKDDKRKVDFRTAKSGIADRKKQEAEERKRKKQEQSAAKEAEQSTQGESHEGSQVDSDEDSEAAAKVSLRKRARKRRAGDDTIPVTFWICNVAIILLVAVGLAFTFQNYSQARKMHEPLSDRNRIVRIAHDLREREEAMLFDVRAFVQFGDLRKYVSYWDAVHSNVIERLTQELVDLGASEAEMRLFIGSSQRRESARHTLSAAMVLAKSAFYGDKSAKPMEAALREKVFQNIAGFEWAQPDTQKLRLQQDHSLLAMYLDPATHGGIIRVPPGTVDHVDFTQAQALSAEQQAELARSFVYSDKLQDDVDYILKNLDHFVQMLDNRTQSDLAQGPDDLDSWLIIVSVLLFAAFLGCALVLHLLSVHPALAPYRSLRLVYAGALGLMIVGGTLPLTVRRYVSRVEDALHAERSSIDAAHLSIQGIRNLTKEVTGFVQFGIDTHAHRYFEALDSGNYSLDVIHQSMLRTQLIDPPEAKLKRLFRELSDTWDRMRQLELTAMAIVVRTQGTQNSLLQDKVSNWLWNISREESRLKDVYRYPPCDKAYLSCTLHGYTNWKKDVPEWTVAQANKVARDTVFGQRYRELYRTLTEGIRSQYGELFALVADALEARKDDLKLQVTVQLVVICVSAGFTLVALSGLLAYVLIQLAENQQQKKHSLDNPLFRTLLLRCRLSLTAVAVLLCVIFIVGMVSIQNTRDFAKNMDLASAREFLVARSMVYANRLVVGTPGQRADALVGIAACIEQISNYRNRLYFGNDPDAGGYNLVGKSASQDVYLFGEDATGTADATLQTYYHDKCTTIPPDTQYNAGQFPAFERADNPLPMPLDMGLRRWVNKLQELVATCEARDGVTEALENECKAVLDNLRKEQVSPLITALETSGDMYETRSRDSINTLSLVAKVVFALTLFTIVLLYIRVFRRMVSSLTEEDHGTKSMLKMIPQDVRESVPAISEYLETGKVDNTDQLQKNFEQSQKLLANILPANISQRLKSGENPIADFHRNITICFTDFCGFTSIASKLNAVEIVTFLNEVFIEYDLIVEMLELEKIKTIGDAYFLAGGLDPNVTDHSLRCVEAALQMFRALDEHNQKHPDRPQLRMRLGTHSGPAVAGCIGVKKVAYDLWGDTVAIAEQMESGGVPDRVHCSPTTKQAIEEYFIFQPRGDSGGKVTFPSFLIVGRKRPTPYMHIVRQAEGRRRDAIANNRW